MRYRPDDAGTRPDPKGEIKMSLSTLISWMFWEEAEAPGPGVTRSAQAATGAPGFLRGMTRFVAVGSLAMVLTAQMAGIRLAAPVDADPSYCVVQSEQCKKACPAGPGNAACVKACNQQREQCRRDQA
jgi:hypothetical protein